MLGVDNPGAFTIILEKSAILNSRPFVAIWANCSDLCAWTRVRYFAWNCWLCPLPGSNSGEIFHSEREEYQARIFCNFNWLCIGSRLPPDCMLQCGGQFLRPPNHSIKRTVWRNDYINYSWCWTKMWNCDIAFTSCIGWLATVLPVWFFGGKAYTGQDKTFPLSLQKSLLLRWDYTAWLSFLLDIYFIS